MTRAVGTALHAAKPEQQDEATVQLARRYAALLDDAQPLARYVKHLAGLRAALHLLDPDDQADALEHFAKIADALSAHSVASDLGPKLLAALTALGLTPAARRAAMGGPNGASHGSPADELRKRRDSRRTRAAT